MTNQNKYQQETKFKLRAAALSQKKNTYIEI